MKTKRSQVRPPAWAPFLKYLSLSRKPADVFYAPTGTHTHSHTHSRTHPHTHSHTHTLTHTHSHLHNPWFLSSLAVLFISYSHSYVLTLPHSLCNTSKYSHYNCLCHRQNHTLSTFLFSVSYSFKLVHLSFYLCSLSFFQTCLSCLPSIFHSFSLALSHTLSLFIYLSLRRSLPHVLALSHSLNLKLLCSFLLFEENAEFLVFNALFLV